MARPPPGDVRSAGAHHRVLRAIGQSLAAVPVTRLAALRRAPIEDHIGGRAAEHPRSAQNELEFLKRVIRDARGRMYQGNARSLQFELFELAGRCQDDLAVIHTDKDGHCVAPELDDARPKREVLWEERAPSSCR